MKTPHHTQNCKYLSLLNSLLLLLQMFNADIPLNTFCICNNTFKYRIFLFFKPSAVGFQRHKSNFNFPIKGQGRRQATKPHACFWTIKRTQVTQKVLTQS